MPLGADPIDRRVAGSMSLHPHGGRLMQIFSQGDNEKSSRPSSFVCPSTQSIAHLKEANCFNSSNPHTILSLSLSLTPPLPPHGGNVLSSLLHTSRSIHIPMRLLRRRKLRYSPNHMFADGRAAAAAAHRASEREKERFFTTISPRT
jgi:hypothetical protein